MPGGRAKTLEYLEKLRDIPKTWRSNPDLPSVTEGRLIPYPEPPQFPIGTRMALVRQMVLINVSGGKHLLPNCIVIVVGQFADLIFGQSQSMDDFGDPILQR